MAGFDGCGTLRATMQNIAHALRERGGRREEIRDGSNNFIYLPLRTPEADEQSLGSGQDYGEWHHFHALGLGSRAEQRHYRSLRGGLRFSSVQPLPWGVEAAGTERHRV
jgi:hypothetical protein